MISWSNHFPFGIFNTKKAGDQIQAKSAIQSQLVQNSELTSMGTALFNTIWANAELSRNLFGNRLEPTAKLYFLNTLVRDLNSSFYDFIKVR